MARGVSRRSGRERELNRILQANKASALGRLMLGKFREWSEFIEAGEGNVDVSLPRRMLKAGHKDVQLRLSKEIKRYCEKNFVGMTKKTLVELYEQIKAYRELKMPLREFETRYAKIKPEILRGIPTHATVVISLWGMQFKFPEDDLAKDIIEALRLAKDADGKLKQYEGITHQEAKKQRDEIAALIRQRLYAARSCILCCFNLLEAYLNGLAWDFASDDKLINSLSNNKKKLIQDSGNTKFRDKLIKYPEIISGTHLWNEGDKPITTFLGSAKIFRDSLVHPSPFAVPEKFGGYNKLEKLYRIDIDIAKETAISTREIILALHGHCRIQEFLPIWLSDFKEKLEDIVN